MSNKDNIHYDGVFEAKKKNGEIYYRSSLTYKKKHISLGSFSTSREAHKAYLEGNQLINNKTLTILSYGHDHSIPFDKWVIIINFRDNNIYFGKPIYLKQRMFEYYLSPSCILKFDMDDLFYYSSHKIMQRGGHYFVADYGMQVNLVSRYGIKNYAVEGKDFVFINGDKTDFRRENLEIWNSYNGVTIENKNGQYTYTVRIHINGNYIVGTYNTEIEAAIAYNKAIDILHKKGVRKNYAPNYIEEISAREYAEIYTNVGISKRLLNYKPTSQNNQ